MRSPRALALLGLSISLAACAAPRVSPSGAAAPIASSRAEPSLVLYAGHTMQGARLRLVVDRHRSVVTALRFSITYACSGGRALTLHALILRPDDSWGVIERWPTTVLGFSDWFSGADGHDFHITGTLSSDGETVRGALHSLLRTSPRGRCDSGQLSYRATRTPGRPVTPALNQITRARFREIRPGTTIAGVERLLGAPDDRDIFRPGGVIAGTLPSGVPGARQAWLDYSWRGHPRRYFQLFFKAGRLLPGQPGRSIALRGG